MSKDKNMRTAKFPEYIFRMMDEMITHRRDTKLPYPDKKDLWYYQLLDVIDLYFRTYKDDYQKFLKLEYKKNV